MTRYEQSSSKKQSIVRIDAFLIECLFLQSFNSVSIFFRTIKERLIMDSLITLGLWNKYHHEVLFIIDFQYYSSVSY